MQYFTEGNIGKHVINFSTPIMFGDMLLSVYGIINMIWVGRLLGHTAVAAISATLPIIMLMPAFLIGLGMATNVLIAQAFGRKDTALLRKILSNSFFTSIALCLVISIIAMSLRHRLLRMGACTAGDSECGPILPDHHSGIAGISVLCQLDNRHAARSG